MFTPVAGTYDVTLIVASDKGCIDTITKQVIIVDKPVFSAGNDTLICSIDTLQLNAVSATPGTVVWSPNYNISNVNSFSPLASPDVTTTYYVSFIDNSGCATSDSVKVNVVDFVTLEAGSDTTICRTDAITFMPYSDGLHYVWSPGASLNDPLIKDPVAIPIAEFTTYHVQASIGKCKADDEFTVHAVPYPLAYAGKDTSVCIGESVNLHASGGSIYSWSPGIFLNATNISDPVSIQPIITIPYVVTVRDVLGCPKPVNDTIIVNVIHIIADAGPLDTAIVTDQPLQLFATGSTIYSWSPSTWLNNTNIANPVALPEDNITYVVRVSNNIGCFDTDTIHVHFFKVKPDMFVPSAFTPNGDGNNDILKPLALGLRAVNVFRVFNRWGQMLFSTSEIGKGWDGTFGGADQPPGTYVWYAEGTDYKNQKLERKGTVVLIR
jgi:gliding motility-associated-like protein